MKNNELLLTIDGNQFSWEDQYISGSQIKSLANIPQEIEIYLSVSAPWKDEHITNESKVDLARPEIEHFYSKQKLELIIDGKKYSWKKQYITCTEIKELSDISSEFEIYLSIKGPWEDELILDDNSVDLARPGIECFYSKRKVESTLVSISINDIDRNILPGNYPVNEIKKIGEVNQAHELEQIIDGKLTPLKDNATVLIKGGEEFFSHVRDGVSS